MSQCAGRWRGEHALDVRVSARNYYLELQADELLGLLLVLFHSLKAQSVGQARRGLSSCFPRFQED